MLIYLNDVNQISIQKSSCTDEEKRVIENYTFSEKDCFLNKEECYSIIAKPKHIMKFLYALTFKFSFEVS